MNIKKQEPLKKGAGVLLPIASLPSNYGIGTFGAAAHDFLDFVANSGLKYWQVLPLGPTGFGDSPYQSFSAFAGNPYFIDLEILMEEGLLLPGEVSAVAWFETEDMIDYSKLYENRFIVLRKAFSRSNHKNQKEFLVFCENQEFWLEDYALFMALKEHYGSLPWTEWPEEGKKRDEQFLIDMRIKLKVDVEFWKFVQHEFYSQWGKLKEYAKAKGIHIIGDIPMYIAMDSADAWVIRDQLHMNDQCRSIIVAGVPPDAFSDTGQLWGNPLYDWEKMEENDYLWWRNRIRHSAMLYDVIRIDHFLGVVHYYCIPYGSESAETGEYRRGPGPKLIEAISQELGASKIIAEDLGIANDEVQELLISAGYPGMKVLLFAFDGSPANPNLPEFIGSNSVVYGGTHDNETLAGFLTGDETEAIDRMKEYFGGENLTELLDRIMLVGFQSDAVLVIFQMQDYLALGKEARINEPSTLGDNWKWRLKRGQLTKDLSSRIRRLKKDR